MTKKLPEECNKCLDRAKLYFSYFKRCAEEEGRYTSIVFSLGYVSMITVYSTIYKYLGMQKKAVFIVFLFISLSTFILHEIWKMVMGILENRHDNDLWYQYFKHEISLDDIEQKTQEYQVKLCKWYLNAYPFIFSISLIFGLLAAILLFLEALCLTF
jgi:hypothetical protein